MRSAGGVQAAPLPTHPQAVFEESVTMMDIPRPLQPLSKFSSTPNHCEKTASGLLCAPISIVLGYLSPSAGLSLFVCSAA